MLTLWNDFDRSFTALDDFRRRMDWLFEDYGHTLGRGRQLNRGSTWPRITLEDDGGRLLARAEVPGLSEKDIELNLNQNVLTLSGAREVKTPEGYSAHRQERSSYRFSRSISLPCTVDPEKAGATVKDGILTVTLEKAAEAQPRQITVKAK